jgi:hypothetical protein
MSAADNGGWDVAVEVAANALSSIVGPVLPPLPQRQLVTPAFQGTVTPQASITGTSLTTAGDLTVNVSIDGTGLRVTNLTVPLPNVMNPPPDWLANIPIKGTVRVTDRLEMRPTLAGGLASATLVIDFTPTPVLNQPAIVAEVDDSFLNAPLIVIALGFAFDLGGQAAFEQLRDNLLQTIRTNIETAVRDAVVGLGAITLVPAPALPFAVTAFAFRATPLSLHVLYAMGPAGNTSLITRSMLLTSSLTGAPVDAAALSLGNVSLLRDFLAASLMGPPLGLPLSMFISGHPCLFVGPISITRRGTQVVRFLPGGPPAGISDISLDSLIAGIDEAGLLHIVARLTATGSAGAFTVSALVDTSFRFAAATTGGALTLTLTPIVPAVVSTDVSIAWWMYVAGALAGGLTLVGVLAAIDSFAGLLINGAVGTAIGGAFPTITVPIPLPGRAAALTLRAVTSTQPDSATRSTTLFPGFTISDPFRSHDLIVNLV